MCAMTGYRTLLATLTLVLAVAGCSSSSKGHGSTPPSHATLAGIVVQRNDLPSGWTSSPPNTSGDKQANQAMRSCVGAGPDKSVETVNSKQFTQGNATISSNARSFSSQADVNGDIALLKSPKVDSCYQRVLRGLLANALPAGATIDKITFHMTSGSGGGPANLVATGTGTIAVTAQGQHVTIYVAAAFISGPLVGAQVSFDDVGQPVPESLQRQVISDVAKRAQQT
jgi:hypothetical protein